MPRYLTATKIALLLLIDTYTTVDLPPTSRHEILNFLAARIIIRSDFDSGSLSERFELATADDISSFADTLSKLPAHVPGRSVYDLFLARVWAIDGLDAIFEFVRNVADSVGSPPAATEDGEETLPKISRVSPLGQFIRRSRVEFTRLQFADAQALWVSFAAFRSSSYPTWAARNPDAAQDLQASEPAWATSTLPTSASAQTSTEDTSLLLSFSIHHLQKLGHRLPPGLKANLAGFLDQNLDSNTQSLQHFLSFFEHWRAGQYTMALESLHRYFDYSIASQGPGAMGRDVGKDSNGGGGSSSGGVRVYYQYALLHLSVLHADFERWEASVAAMEECVATARESQDTPCLVLALSWLLYLRQAQSNAHAYTHDTADISTTFGNLAISSSTQADEITFLKTKAREMKYWSLLSSTLLDEARGELMSGTATVKALEHLLQAQHLNTTHDLRTQMPATLLFQAAAMERLGHSTLSQQTYTNILSLHSTTIPLPERIRAGCRLAQSLEQRGDFAQAMKTLDELEQSIEQPGTLKSRQRVMGWRGVILMKRELRRDNITTATHHCNSLQPFLSLSSDPDLSFEIFTLGIELQLKQNRRSEALAAINERIRIQKQNPSTDITQTLTLLLLKARTFTSTSPQTSSKAFSIVLRTASTAHRYNLLPHLCEAVALLGKILNDLGEYEAARGLVEGVLLLALQTHNAPLHAQLYSTLTDSLIGVAFSPSHSSSTSQQHPSPSKTTTIPALAQAEKTLNLAHELHTALADHQAQLDCLIKKEMIAKYKGDARGAEEAEAGFIRLVEEKKRERGGEVRVGDGG